MVAEEVDQGVTEVAQELNDHTARAPIRVIVHGATGRMGRETLTALIRDPSLVAVGGVGSKNIGDTLPLPNDAGTIPYDTDLALLLSKVNADVVVDFTNATAAMSAANTTALNHVHFVTGTSGLSPADIDALRDLSATHKVGIIVGPSFALGAVLLNHLVRIVAPYFDYVDIFEAHHEAKIDAPSGTAAALARAASENRSFSRPDPEKELILGTRGGEINGVTIHSTRMPGRLANHEVTFGMSGQTLSLKHDTLSRECFMPGVIMAIKAVISRRDALVGLENLLNLK